MAAKKSSPAFAFVVSYLEKNPSAEFSEVRDAAARKGYKIFPIVYGRAKAHLNLVPTKARGSKKAATRRAASVAGPGRPRAQARVQPRTSASSGLSDLQTVIATVKENEAERERLRAALEQIRDILNEAL